MSKESRKAYMKEYIDTHRAARNEAQRRWYKKKKAENPDYFKAQAKRYRARQKAKDPDYFKKKNKQYRQRKKEQNEQ